MIDSQFTLKKNFYFRTNLSFHIKLALLGQTTWNDDDIERHCLVQNAQMIGIADTVFEALVSHNPLQKHAISSAHMSFSIINKPKKRLQDRFILHTNGTIKKDKVKTVWY